MPLTYLSVLNFPPPSSESTRLGLSPIVLWELCMLPTCQISDFHRGCSLSPLSVSTSHANTFLCSPGLHAFPLSFSYSASCLRWLIRPPCCFTWAISVARADSGWRHCDRWVKLLYLDSFAAPDCLPVFVFSLFVLSHQNCRQPGWLDFFYFCLFAWSSWTHSHAQRSYTSKRCTLQGRGFWFTVEGWMHVLMSSSGYGARGMHLGTPVRPNAVIWIWK